MSFALKSFSPPSAPTLSKECASQVGSNMKRWEAAVMVWGQGPEQWRQPWEKDRRKLGRDLLEVTSLSSHPGYDS